MNDVSFKKNEIVSALIKAMRFGDFGEAAYWMIVLLENNIEEKYITHRLAIFASEDCFDADLITLANSIRIMYEMKLGNGNMLWQLLFRCCKAKKFWELPDGQEYEETMNNAIERYKKNGLEKAPKWAIDSHTTLYHELVKEGRLNETDERFSGNDKGRLHMIKMYKKYGRVSPDIVDDKIWKEATDEIEKLI
ncbi:MAG: hypothetical protein CVU87_08155 [Firmicutes bacterium HGW-Firmicutes-12]|jgi:replication-associated recombination protein RarA|nr:MAG: hypothetical protein CVU87_08155 [Firmicutes bacterium HGW-Firmicutes-12]